MRYWFIEFTTRPGIYFHRQDKGMYYWTREVNLARRFNTEDAANSFINAYLDSRARAVPIDLTLRVSKEELDNAYDRAMRGIQWK